MKDIRGFMKIPRREKIRNEEIKQWRYKVNG